jgi:hypothetical protein
VALDYEGAYLFATLDRMAREEKIEKLSRCRWRSLTNITELRKMFGDGERGARRPSRGQK